MTVSRGERLAAELASDERYRTAEHEEFARHFSPARGGTDRR